MSDSRKDDKKKDYGTFGEPLKRKKKENYGTFPPHKGKGPDLRDIEDIEMDERGLDHKHSKPPLTQHSIFSPSISETKRIDYEEITDLTEHKRSLLSPREQEQFLLSLLRKKQTLGPADEKTIAKILKNIKGYIIQITDIYKARNPNSPLDLETHFLNLLAIIQKASSRDILVFYTMQFVWMMNSLSLSNSDILDLDPLTNYIQAKIEILTEKAFLEEKSPTHETVARLIHDELELLVQRAFLLQQDFQDRKQKLSDDSPEAMALAIAIKQIDLLLTQAITLQKNIIKAKNDDELIKISTIAINTLRAIIITGGMSKENIHYVKHHQAPVNNFFISECASEMVILVTQLYSSLPLLTSTSENIYVSLQLALIISQGVNIPLTELGEVSAETSAALTSMSSMEDLTQLSLILKNGIQAAKKYIKENPIDSSLKIAGIVAFPLLFIPSLPISALIALEVVSTAATGKGFFNFLRARLKESKENDAILLILNTFEGSVSQFVNCLIHDIEKTALEKQTLQQIRELLTSEEKLSEQEMKQYFSLVEKSKDKQDIILAKIFTAPSITHSIINREVKQLALEFKNAGITEAKSVTHHLFNNTDNQEVLAILARRYQEPGQLSTFLKELALSPHSEEHKQETSIAERLANECSRIISPERVAEIILKIHKVAAVLAEAAENKPEKIFRQPGPT